MGENSKIAWTHATFNAWIGCVHKSPGCENCYAEVETFPRVQRSHGLELWGAHADRHITSASNWAQPIKWNAEAAAAGERRRVFCSSLSDVFEDRPDLVAPRARLYKLIQSTPSLDWLLLTKRPEHADRLWAGANVDAWDGSESIGPVWLPNVWLGASVEDRKRALERLPILRGLRAMGNGPAIVFVSAEPLLEDISLELHDALFVGDEGGGEWAGAPRQQIDWVIVGGESGTHARLFDLGWARSIVDMCKRARTACFVKQLGADPIDGAAGCSPQFRDKKAGDPGEWPPELVVREFPVNARLVP